MTPNDNQLLRLTEPVGGVDAVLLVLSEGAGTDFTFYVRDEQEGGSLSEYLRRQQGGQAAGLPGKESSFSCRITVLRPLLDAGDFRSEKVESKKQTIFLRKLREPQKADVKKYAALRQILDEQTLEGLDAGQLDDESSLALLVTKLNELLESRLEGEPFEDSLTADDIKLIAAVKGAAAQIRVSNYLGFCSLFKEDLKFGEPPLRIGRVLAGLSHEGEWWSISFRRQESGTGFAPSQECKGTLNSIAEICDVLYEQIFRVVSRSEAAGRGEQGQESEKDKRPLPEVGGLVVIAGSTNSAKSLITRGLIHLYLEDVLRGDPERRPHLVTFEDPIEKYFVDPKRAAGAAPPHDTVGPRPLEERVDYTPRQQKVDTAGLQAALDDALRQTPKVFFVGETRRKDDWQSLIDFAGTGHLVVTTAHAGSLIEALHKILLATRAKTPADRNEVASRILAVIQLKRTEVAGFDKCAVLVPAIWRRVPRGVNSLTAEGLASILPHSHSDEANPCSCLGRKYFAGRLLGLAAGRGPVHPRFEAALKAKAIDWDLQGA